MATKAVIAAEINLNTNAATESVKSFKTRVREATQELNTMTEKFGATSAQAEAAAKKVAHLRDAIGDAKQLADTFNPDKKFVALGGALQGAVGGFTALQGAMGLFGSESQEVQKLLLKVQSAMALQQGLSAIAGAIDSFKLLGKVIITNVVTAFSTLKGALIATGIGALVVTLALVANAMNIFGDETESAADAQERLAEETKRSNEAINSQISSIDSINAINIKRAKLAGISEKGITDLERKAIQERIDIRNKEIDARLENGQAITELTQANSKDIDAIINFDLDNQLKAQDKANEAARKAADERASINKKAIEERKKQLEEAAKFEEDFHKFVLQSQRDAAKAAIDDEKALREEDAIKEQERLDQEKFIADQKISIAKNLAEQIKAKQDEELKNEQILYEQKMMFANATVNGLSALSDIVGKETATGKALAVAASLINTYSAIAGQLKAFAGLPIPGFAIAQAIATGLVGFAAVRNILKTNVPGKGSGGGGSVPSISAVVAPIQQAQVQRTALDQNSINQIGNAANRAYVLESDVSGNQERIKKLNRAARIN